ncbi:MAG: 3-phosphoshikimate 1-carboxyvinyltransferase [Flavobacteriales bacterium TMED288]|nr:3-phosphoshikimate 1-carboxyvinyltransferase [Flavobacteriales bacterium]RPG53475.1 MAG: 3-phosphoshikimate 1-carboxyvinyltransferase [Flavobacteriales bacterium TMED288]
MNYKITSKSKKLFGEISIDSSKSISNRIVITRALEKKKLNIKGISSSSDTKILIKSINNKSKIINLNNAGGPMRFLTAFFSLFGAKKILTGNHIMKNRPIKDLVKSINYIGGNISYIEKFGFPPIYINGGNLVGGNINIDGNISSQFISAILLIAPYTSKGVILNIKNNLVSKSYVEMTINMMKSEGIDIIKKNKIIDIKPGRYLSKLKQIEPDWSSISYLYEIAALSESCEIEILNISSISIQGDIIIKDIFKNFGVKTIFLEKNMKIFKSKNYIKPRFFQFNCRRFPDIALTIITTCFGLSIDCKINGLETLIYKESNRLLAIKNELQKCGAQINIINQSEIELKCQKLDLKKNVNFKSYDDHRIIMSLAPLALRFKSVSINNIENTEKSYPNFWTDLKKLSFNLKKI